MDFIMSEYWIWFIIGFFLMVSGFFLMLGMEIGRKENNGIFR
jgi:hypothetical protein